MAKTPGWCKPGYKCTPKKKRKPSKFNKCVKKQLKGKVHKGKAAWMKVFKAAANACKK